MKWLKYFEADFEPGSYFLKEMDRQLVSQFESIAKAKLNWKRIELLVDPFDYLIYEEKTNVCLINCSLDCRGYSIKTQIKVLYVNSSRPVLLFSYMDRDKRQNITEELEISINTFNDPYDNIEVYTLKDGPEQRFQFFKNDNLEVFGFFNYIPHEGYLEFNAKVDESILQELLSKFVNDWNEGVLEGASGLIHNLEVTEDIEKTKVYLDCGSAELENLDVLYGMISEGFVGKILEIELQGV
jgi:hypothetical protein